VDSRPSPAIASDPKHPPALRGGQTAITCQRPPQPRWPSTRPSISTKGALQNKLETDRETPIARACSLESLNRHPPAAEPRLTLGAVEGRLGPAALEGLELSAWPGKPGGLEKASSDDHQS